MKSYWKSAVVALMGCVLAGRDVGDGESAAVCGDLNNSGGANPRSIADVVLLFRAVLEEPDPSPLCGGAGVLNCGNVINNPSDGANADQDQRRRRAVQQRARQRDPSSSCARERVTRSRAPAGKLSSPPTSPRIRSGPRAATSSSTARSS